MKIRMKIAVAGQFHNISEGVKVGDVVDVDDESGANYCQFGYAEAVRSHQKAEPEPEPEPEPEEEPEEEHAIPPKVEEHAVKRGPGRPRKAQ